MIYLDNNATTPVDPDVKWAVMRGLDTFGNPSSVHRFGRMAREVVESARKKVAELLDVHADEIIFTSGGTESNNLALCGYAFKRGSGHIISSVIEHPSVKNTLSYLSSKGFSVSLARVNEKGQVEPDEIKRLLRQDTILVSIMHANNETGIIQPIGEISGLLKERGIVFHTDAAQSVGKIEVKVSELGVDMLTVAAHKFYGPKGVGAFFLRKGIEIESILRGASQEKGLRPGTENVPLIAGLGKAAELADTLMPLRETHIREITERLLRLLKERISDTVLNGEEAPRLPNTLNISFAGIVGAELVRVLSEKVAISAGSACHEGTYRASESLLAMGIPEGRALSSVRISTGKDNTLDDIEDAAEAISEAVKALRSRR